MKEVFKDIPGYKECYQVSNLGRVKSLKRIVSHKRYGKQLINDRILKPANTKDGYLRLSLQIKRDKSRSYLVHRLVLLTFIGDSFLEIDHINGIKADNRLKNLRYCTKRQNMIWWSLRSDKTLGANYNKNGWEANIKIGGKCTYLGRFKTKEAAQNEYLNRAKTLLQDGRSTN